MNRYTIHCTPEQTKKALKLGAPIEEAMSRYNARNAIQRVESGKETIEEYANKGIALVNRGYVKKALKIPTAEQMIGWIEENKYMTIEVLRTCVGYRYFAYFVVGRKIGGRYDTRSEAILAAIDAVLEYMENHG